MNPNLSDWDDDLPPELEEAYQDLLRALRRKSGFGLFFVQCTPGEADNFIVKLPQEMPQKKIAVLRLVEAIDNLYQPVTEFIKDKQIDILLIKGLEYSLYKYEKRNFGEITEGEFSNLTNVPHILNHLNQQRERFRDDFPVSFVFLLRSFSINYFIHRAPDFFDWRSGVFELPTAPELVEQESNRLLLEGDYEEYLQLSSEEKIGKILEIQELITETYQKVIRRSNLLFKMGNLLFAGNEYEGAITSYEQALKIQPEYHYAWNGKGNALVNLGRNAEAIASYDKALKFKPDFHLAWNNRGIALYDLGRFEEAIASYDQALKIKPDFHLAWNNRGNALDELGRPEEAITSYDQALKFKLDYHQAWYNRGIALDNLGRPEKAIASYDQALKIKPDDHQAWNNRGYALDDLGRTEEAIASYDQALKFKPDLHQAWYNRGIALDDLGRTEEAIASYDQALKFKPDYSSPFYNKACYYALQGNIEQALENLQQTINLNPDKYREMAKSDSDFDSIREDERFQALIQ
ncbi:tetratricopeptide repeat protein [Nostoc sp. LPT]|uniref:tetratricopeptide repeat protein n=1 Tax=Nostoc sp. LPT TaxID=2815387 RepID=UPI001D69987D|nr:tetratricopeptide repeat protein [Nostoc sp. LPT]MBN4002635.1 tetratricopeptide repeat protein [Nostoc sp. LPT]